MAYFGVLMLLLGVPSIHGRRFYKRNENCEGYDAMRRQLRSTGGLNNYLADLAKCIASYGRPRFGKRGWVHPALTDDEAGAAVREEFTSSHVPSLYVAAPQSRHGQKRIFTAGHSSGY